MPEAGPHRGEIRPRAGFIALMVFVGALPVALHGCYRLATDTTVYAPGYSESAFATVTPGMEEAEVVRLLGPSIETYTSKQDVMWFYAPPGFRLFPDGSFTFRLPYTYVAADETGLVVRAGHNDLGGGHRNVDPEPLVGVSLEVVEERLGPPTAVRHQPAQRILQYSASDSDGSYYRRWVSIDPSGKVEWTDASWYQD